MCEAVARKPSGTDDGCGDRFVECGSVTLGPAQSQRNSKDETRVFAALMGRLADGGVGVVWQIQRDILARLPRARRENESCSVVLAGAWLAQRISSGTVIGGPRVPDRRETAEPAFSELSRRLRSGTSSVIDRENTLLKTRCVVGDQAGRANFSHHAPALLGILPDSHLENRTADELSPRVAVTALEGFIHVEDATFSESGNGKRDGAGAKDLGEFVL